MDNPEYKIFNTFFELKESKLYFNQLKEYTKFSNSSLQNVLNKLINKNILKVEKTKQNTFYKIKNKKLFELKFSEIAIKKFNQLNLDVRIPLENFINEINFDIFTLIIFGSASRKEEHEESDIDILIVTNKKNNLEKIKNKVNNVSNYPISLFICSRKEFLNNVDPIIIQVKKTGFPIYKEQNFYEVILNEYR